MKKIALQGLQKKNFTLLQSDPIYGSLQLSNMCLQVAQSAVVQRLKNISQLGYIGNFLPLVTRYEHSLGVAHLSRIAGQSLQQNHPEYKISEREILRLELAGLLHDCGHGPFSHTFDYEYLPHTKFHKHPNHYHEKRSLQLVPLALENYPTEDIQWVQHMIHPEVVECPDPKRAFLGQIVSNPTHGMDTDKLDYLARDALHLENFNFISPPCLHALQHENESIFQNIQITKGQITFHPVHKTNLIQKSYLRKWLFENIYHHPQTRLFQKQIASIIPDHYASIITDMKKFIQYDDLSILKLNIPLPSAQSFDLSPSKLSQHPFKMLPRIDFHDGSKIDVSMLNETLFSG